MIVIPVVRQWLSQPPWELMIEVRFTAQSSITPHVAMSGTGMNYTALYGEFLAPGELLG